MLIQLNNAGEGAGRGGRSGGKKTVLERDVERAPLGVALRLLEDREETAQNVGLIGSVGCE